jgi:MOSC domain-containing protein YiiM
MQATIVALHLTPRSRASLEHPAQVEAVAGQGLAGNRHTRPGSRRQVLLMDAETLERLALQPGDVREQVTVRGLDLNGLAMGTRLRAGSAVLEMGGPCAPCERMNELRPGLMQVLEGRRGRFAHVVQAGTFAVGDPLVVLDAETAPA